jgi:hypothetical protein
MRILTFAIIIFIFPLILYSQDKQCENSIFKENYSPSFLDRLIKDWRCPECKDVKTSCQSYMIKEFPEIIMIGEAHHNPFSVVIKKELLDSSLKGKNVLLTEVLENEPAFQWIKISHTKDGPVWYDRKKDGGNLYGIDSIIPNTLAQNYFYLSDLLSGEDSSMHTIQNFLKLVEISPLARGAFEKLKVNVEFYPYYEKLNKYLSLNYEDKSQEANQILESIPKQMIYNLIVFMHMEIINIARSEFKEQVFGVNLPYILTQEEAKSYGLYPGGKIGGEFQNLFMRVRNNHFAARINDLLCDLVKEHKKRIYILMGDAHVEGVKSLLEGLSNYNIKITYLKSYNKEDAIKLNKLIGE